MSLQVSLKVKKPFEDATGPSNPNTTEVIVKTPK